MDIRLIDEFAEELAKQGYISSWAAKPYDGETEFELFCPAHEDPATSKKPSATWQPMSRDKRYTRGVMHCHKPGCGLDPDANVARKQFLQNTGGNVVDIHSFDPIFNKDKPQKGHAKKQPTPDEDTIATYRDMLADDPEHLEYMENDKGILAHTLKEYEWGWIGAGKKCYIYPVRDQNGNIAGARLYDPFHLSLPKKRWYATEAKNSNALYGTKQVDEDASTLILFEGETDTMLAHQDGFGNAVTQTGGAGTWKPSYNWFFRHKVVYICYDADPAGRDGASKVAKALKNVAQAVHIVVLPEGSDYSSWRADGHAPDEFKDLLKSSIEASRIDTTGLPAGGHVISSVAGIKSVLHDDVLEVVSHIAGKGDTSYRLPRRITLNCNQDQGSKCNGCPLNINDGEMTIELSPDKDDILVEMMEAKSAARHKMIKDDVGLHCAVFEETEESNWHVEMVNIQDPVDSEHTNNIDASITAMHFYAEDSQVVTPGEGYRVVGRTLSDPRNSRLAYAAWLFESVHTDMDNYKLTDAGKEMLFRFRPSGWTSERITRKLEGKYEDLATNVTGIMGRPDLHLMYDLVMHSAIQFNFNGGDITKGWLDAIVMGDTRTGKTEVVQQLNKHYHAGHLVSGENASFAGLVGGSSEMPGRSGRMVMWGILPRYDRRAVQIDEASGMGSLLSQMSDVRSSGKAQVNKQGGGEASAKVRLLWMSNPTMNINANRSRSIRDIRGGAVAAIMDMVKMQEDVARFDIAMSAASSDVPIGDILMRRYGDDPEYTDEMCHEMIMYAWSRKPEQIKFARGATDLINRLSMSLSKRYSESPPLVQSADINKKVARMAVALATMTFSTDTDDDEVILVRKCHAKYIYDFIVRLYDDPMFGYGAFSREHYARIKHAKSMVLEVTKWFKGGRAPVAGLPTGPVVLRALKQFPGYFEPRSLGAAVGNMDGDVIVNYLVDCGLVTRSGGKNVDTSSELNDIMKRLS